MSLIDLFSKDVRNLFYIEKETYLRGSALEDEYERIQRKESRLSKRERDLVIKKYLEVHPQSKEEDNA